MICKLVLTKMILTGQVSERELGQVHTRGSGAGARYTIGSEILVY